MNDYIQVGIVLDDAAKMELLVALLAEMGYEGFEETEEGLQAFIPSDRFDAPLLEALSKEHDFAYSTQSIAPQNWNAIWESGFEPVVIPGFVAIRAAFHPPHAGVQYEIIITPKMSFGTGHHATTYMMVQAMAQFGFSGKTVLDFGTGTGVLAILAEKLGAPEVLAIDNDEWSIDNANENAQTNGCNHIIIQQAEEVPTGQRFDIILANINLNVIKDNLSAIASACQPRANVLLSGFLPEDEGILQPLLIQSGFQSIGKTQKDNWLCLHVTAP